MKERLLHRLQRWFRDFRDRHDLRYTITRLRRERQNWENTAAQYARSAEYYRGLVVQCGDLFGEDARRQDDGGIVDHVLCAKVPELVEQLVNQCAGQEAALRQPETVKGEDVHYWARTAEALQPLAYVASHLAMSRKDAGAVRDDVLFACHAYRASKLVPHFAVEIAHGVRGGDEGGSRIAQLLLEIHAAFGRIDAESENSTGQL